VSDQRTPESSVGYANPPRHTRFKKGQSGNPKGRVKSSKNLATVLMATVHEAVAVNEGGRRKTITKLEAMSKQLVNKAASGDPRATQLLMQMIQMFEGRSDEPTREAVIEEADELIVQQLFVRIRDMVGEEKDGHSDVS
jgi:Family of unknown function (DUF5681)